MQRRATALRVEKKFAGVSVDAPSIGAILRALPQSPPPLDEHRGDAPSRLLETDFRGVDSDGSCRIIGGSLGSFRGAL
jgi:hypothetical protein